MDLLLIESLAQTFDELGPWAGIVLLGIYILKQDKAMKVQDNKFQEVTERIFNLTEKKIESDIKQEEAFKGLRDVIQALISRL